MQQRSALQQMRAPKEAAFDFSFYAPYKAAVETAFLSLCAARMQLEEEHTPFAVRSMTFRLKSPASIREKLLRRGLPQNAQGAASLHDVAGLRVVLSSVEAVYHFADILRASTAWQFVCARGLHRRAEEERLSRPASGDARARLLKRPECLRSGRDSAPDARDGYVGLRRA